MKIYARAILQIERYNLANLDFAVKIFRKRMIAKNVFSSFFSLPQSFLFHEKYIHRSTQMRLKNVNAQQRLNFSK